MIATFHKAASRFSDTKPIALRINLSSFIAMPKAYKSVLKFCLITFVPTLIITEKFADNSTLLSGFNELIDSLSAPPMIIYDQSCPLNQMNSEEMAVFLKSIRKASTLILNGSCLDHWNPSELEQLIDAIKENPNLISLDLKQTQLNTWYIDSEKFPWLLELIKLEQLTRLDLPPYHERELPASHLEQLQWTIRMRHYRHTPVYEHIVAPKTSGLFNKKSPKLDPCTAVFGCEKSPAR